MSSDAVEKYVNKLWDESILAELREYIKIPNKSVAFDPDWQLHGHMDQVAARFEAWARRQPLKTATFQIVRLQKRTPLLFIEIPGNNDDCVLLYGHMDKQPEMGGWREGLSPWSPVLEGDRLYGRGAADDGYAMFAALGAVGALQTSKIPHARCVVIIEACEESGSFDLPAYIDHLAPQIGKPSLVVALDSGCGNYEQLWCTTSLRGLVGGVLTVEMLSEGVHSGDAGGVVADTFRVARHLLERIENAGNGELLGAEFHAPIPPARINQARAAAQALGDTVHSRFPFVPGAGPIARDPAEVILKRTWRPALAVIGADGLPAADDAGNVLRPRTALKLSLRLPPTADPKAAVNKLRSTLEANPPYGARVTLEPNWGARGWDAPEMAPWLERSIDGASRQYFGKPAAYMGEGGTIPFMAMLGERFPEAQFLISGVLGPHSNAHGANEFLHLPTARKLTSCVARVLADHFRR